MRDEIIIANINGVTRTYYGATGWELFHGDTFNPYTEYDFVVLGRIKGKTYKEKKARARDLAVSVSLFDCSGLSWWEYSELENYFERLAHRFGLVREFKENGII